MRKPMSFFSFCKNILFHPIRFLDTYFPQEASNVEDPEKVDEKPEEILAEPLLKDYAKRVCLWTYTSVLGLLMLCGLLLCFFKEDWWSVLSKNLLGPKDFLNAFQSNMEEANGTSKLFTCMMVVVLWHVLHQVYYQVSQWLFKSAMSSPDIPLSDEEVDGLYAYISAPLYLILGFEILLTWSLTFIDTIAGSQILLHLSRIGLFLLLEIMISAWGFYFVHRVTKAFTGESKEGAVVIYFLPSFIIKLLPFMFM